MADERLGHQVFGSSSLVVRCPVIDTLVSLSERLEGQLTATLDMEPVAKIWSGGFWL
jgi:NADP-dependent aldehyde dehydrogenase